MNEKKKRYRKKYIIPVFLLSSVRQIYVAFKLRKGDHPELKVLYDARYILSAQANCDYCDRSYY